MKNKIICTMCNKTLNWVDLNEKYNFHFIFGYGSNFDENIFDATLCCHCMNRILKTILPLFKNWPLTPYDTYSPSLFEKPFLDKVRNQEGLEAERRRVKLDAKYLKKLIKKKS